MYKEVNVITLRLIFLPLGVLLCIGAFISANMTNPLIEKETGKAIGTVYKCDFPMFKDAGFHNNIEFATANGEKYQFYQSTIELLSVNSKVPVRYDPANPRDKRQIDNWIEMYQATGYLLLLGVSFVVVSVCTFFKK
jgi:hypothetical protein